MNLKPYLSTLLLFVGALQLQAQEKKSLTLSLSTGIFNSPYYKAATAKQFYSFDADYCLTERQILSTNFNAGSHDYFDDVLSNVPNPIYNNKTNGSIKYRTFSILYKYKFLSKEKFSIAAGTGAGIMTHTQSYIYQSGNSQSPQEATWTDLVFPVRVETDVKLSNRMCVGIIGGFFIHPDFPILGYHAGLRLGYILK